MNSYISFRNFWLVVLFFFFFFNHYLCIFTLVYFSVLSVSICFHCICFVFFPRLFCALRSSFVCTDQPCPTRAAKTIASLDSILRLFFYLLTATTSPITSSIHALSSVIKLNVIRLIQLIWPKLRRKAVATDHLIRIIVILCPSRYTHRHTHTHTQDMSLYDIVIPVSSR